jgi:hypothetical protein
VRLVIPLRPLWFLAQGLLVLLLLTQAPSAAGACGQAAGLERLSGSCVQELGGSAPLSSRDIAAIARSDIDDEPEPLGVLLRRGESAAPPFVLAPLLQPKLAPLPPSHRRRGAPPTGPPSV